NWYLVISNHQSWVDIFVLQRCLHGRIPLLKFFIKQQLIWVPFLGLAWWALDFPFMKRYSKSYLEKHPEKKGQDLETTRKSCEKFQQIPTSVTNFLEGTRFTAIKHQQQSSPYKHLLKPKAGGMAFAMSVMGKQFDSVLDVTIHYPNGAPSFIGFLKGELAGCQVYIERLVINENLIDGDYQNDSQYRQDFQQWVDQIWQAKDARLDALKHRP
ncbi:MAG: acyltransferase, partial [Oceanobacter sp.]